jgi:phosphatidylserine/phosphatidylglycerophosphate/cardiolipin synthase-like enzyme
MRLSGKRAKKWWTTKDFPVHDDSRVTYLIDGREAMFELCCHMLTASSCLYLGYWGFTATIELVRGSDRCIEDEHNTEEESLLAILHNRGFTNADITFWRTHSLTMQEVLKYVVQKGVDVKVLLWGCPELFAHYSPKAAYDTLSSIGVSCILDPSGQGILNHPAASLHQKIAVIDGITAFVGGLDPLIETGGQFDRWDTHMHEFVTPLRQMENGLTPQPWHDVQALIEGSAARDVEYNFLQRWNDVVQRKHMKDSLLIRQAMATPLLEHGGMVQIARTIPSHTYRFTLRGIHSISRQYNNAFALARQHIYIENQYLWLRAYTGINLPFIGKNSYDMKRIVHKLIHALKHGVSITIILPDSPNVGRTFTDAGLCYLYKHAPEALAQGRLQIFCLATSQSGENGTSYRPIYQHAKVAIVDDIWSTVGSANLNNRGMHDDTEMNVAVLDQPLASSLRMTLIAEHLHMIGNHNDTDTKQKNDKAFSDGAQLSDLSSVEIQKLQDSSMSLHMMHEQAWENLRKYQAGESLTGHILPYYTRDEACKHGLQCNENKGWIEASTYSQTV